MIVPVGESSISIEGSLEADTSARPVKLWVTKKRVAVEVDGGGVLLEFTLDSLRSVSLVSDRPNTVAIQYKDGSNLPTIRIAVHGPHLARGVAVAIEAVAAQRPTSTSEWKPILDIISAAIQTEAVSEKKALAAAKATEEEKERGPIRSGHWILLRCEGVCKGTVKNPIERLELSMSERHSMLKCAVCGWSDSAEGTIRRQGITSFIPAISLAGLGAISYWYWRDSWEGWVLLAIAGLFAASLATGVLSTRSKLSAARPK